MRWAHNVPPRICSHGFDVPPGCTLLNVVAKWGNRSINFLHDWLADHLRYIGHGRLDTSPPVKTTTRVHVYIPVHFCTSQKSMPGSQQQGRTINPRYIRHGNTKNFTLRVKQKSMAWAQSSPGYQNRHRSRPTA